MNEQVLDLVRRGLDDDAAAEVALDALEEAGWEDFRIYGFRCDGLVWRAYAPMLSDIPPWRVTPSDRLRACAAVIIFGEWPQGWPLAIDCWENDEYETSDAWFGLERYEDPSRLAGQNYESPPLLQDLWSREMSGRAPMLITLPTAEETEQYGRPVLKEGEGR